MAESNTNGNRGIDVIRTAFLESAALKSRLASDEAFLELIKRATEEIISTLKSGGKVIAFGNGGSAADAQHFVAELVGAYLRRDREPLPAVALTTNTSNLTSIANDYGFKEVFRRQLRAIANPHDIVLAISTSGMSENVNLAVRLAKEMGLKVIALTGKTGGELLKLADIAILVPSNSTPRIQELHELILHVMCELIEKAWDTE